jgi:hypothetical protein
LRDDCKLRHPASHTLTQVTGGLQGDGSRANARQCTAHRNGQAAAYVAAGALLRMAECHLSGNGAMGVAVAGARARCDLTHCQLASNAVAGAYVHDLGTLTLHHTSVGGNGRCALVAGGRDSGLGSAGLIEYGWGCDVRGRAALRGGGRIVNVDDDSGAAPRRASSEASKQ